MASTRLEERIKRDFPAEGSAVEGERLVAEVSEVERVQAAVVLRARDDMSRLRDALNMALTDWRDSLVRADLAHEDWREQLDVHLGSE